LTQLFYLRALVDLNQEVSMKNTIMDLVRLHGDLQRIQVNTEDPVHRLIYQAIASQISDAVAELDQYRRDNEELEIGAHDIRVVGE
jgi:hypothetical protein